MKHAEVAERCPGSQDQTHVRNEPVMKTIQELLDVIVVMSERCMNRPVLIVKAGPEVIITPTKGEATV